MNLYTSKYTRIPGIDHEALCGDETSGSVEAEANLQGQPTQLLQNSHGSKRKTLNPNP